MNIFILDTAPKVCATYTCDKHVCKMIIESAQLLMSAHNVLDNATHISHEKIDYKEDQKLWKLTHHNHGCSVWVRESVANYRWLYTLFTSLCDEYKLRYGKTHSVDEQFRNVIWVPPENIEHKPMSTPYLAMPEYCKSDSTVTSYQRYYQKEKYEFAEWTYRTTPFFMYEKIREEPAEDWSDICASYLY